MLTLQVAGKSTTFLVDTGATYSVLPSFSGALRPSQVSVVGIDVQPSHPLATGPVLCRLEKTFFTHSFLVLPPAQFPY